MDEEVPRKHRVADFARLECTDDILPASDPVLNARDQVLLIRRNRDQFRPEIERLAALSRALDAEEERLKLIVMDSIRPARGIAGAAPGTLSTDLADSTSTGSKPTTSNSFDQYRTKLDAGQFRRERPNEHRAHLRVKRHHKFQWLDRSRSLDYSTHRHQSLGPNDSAASQRQRGTILIASTRTRCAARPLAEVLSGAHKGNAASVGRGARIRCRLDV